MPHQWMAPCFRRTTGTEAGAGGNDNTEILGRCSTAIQLLREARACSWLET